VLIIAVILRALLASFTPGARQARIAEQLLHLTSRRDVDDESVVSNGVPRPQMLPLPCRLWE
jgi:hypothetical protein